MWYNYEHVNDVLTYHNKFKNQIEELYSKIGIIFCA